MKVVFHEKYKEVYSADPAARVGRMESIYNELCGEFAFIEPVPANEEDLRLVHAQKHIDSIKKRKLYDNALLAVGGAIRASKFAMEGEPAFGLIRPHGHHASPSSCWGFCFFNNVAVSVEKLRKDRKVKKSIRSRH